jgi:hypothetical protein
MHHRKRSRSPSLAKIAPSLSDTIPANHDHRRSLPQLRSWQHRRGTRAPHSASCAPRSSHRTSFPRGRHWPRPACPGSRVAEAGLHNVRFTQSDVNQIVSDKPFDAAVGRFILQFLPEPVTVLRSLAGLVRPGGVLSFQEVSYAPFLLLCSHLPLWSAAASLIHETIQRSGAHTEIGLAQFRFFQEAGLPVPTMRMEMLLGSDPDFTRWIYDLLCSLRPQIQRLNLSVDKLGNFATLPERLQAEVAASKTVVPFVALVGAWSRKPDNQA